MTTDPHEFDGLSRAVPTSPIVDDTTLAFADAAAEINRLMTRTLLIAQRAVESAVAEAERRAEAVVAQAEEHARIVGERARSLIDEGLQQQQRELSAAATASHARLIALLDEAVRRLESGPPGSAPSAADDAFFTELRQAVGGLHAERPSSEPSHNRHHRWRSAGSYWRPSQ